MKFIEPYLLYCPTCGREIKDNFANSCFFCGQYGALIRTRYQQREISVTDRKGIWKFEKWLPVRKAPRQAHPGTVAFPSKGIGRELGLRNLYIGFNGYWPEKGAMMVTGSFKELEAPPTLQRAAEKGVKGLILSSAGNTALAFMRYAGDFPVRVVIVVPEHCRRRMSFPGEVPENVTIIGVNGGADYLDAINFSGRISKILGLSPEGGARNVARRDGMGTVVLEAVLEMKRIPAYYFQAVGSGAGAIAAQGRRIRGRSERLNWTFPSS